VCRKNLCAPSYAYLRICVFSKEITALDVRAHIIIMSALEVRMRLCYVLTTLILLFRYMSRSIVISSFLSSDQLNFTVTKCVVLSSIKCYLEVEFKLTKQIYFQLQHQSKSLISHKFRAHPSSLMLISISSQR